MAIMARTTIEGSPEIYYEDDDSDLLPLRCLAKGVDSALYTVPVELGGWQFRTRLIERIDESKLRRLPAPISQEIFELIWGDTGEVTIAEKR